MPEQNSIQGNVYIITSATTYLTGSNRTVATGSRNGDVPKMMISNIGLYGVGSNSELAISYSSDTSQVTYHLKTQAEGGGYDDIHFAQPHMVSEALFVHTLTAGTGYIYFS